MKILVSVINMLNEKGFMYQITSERSLIISEKEKLQVTVIKPSHLDLPAGDMRRLGFILTDNSGDVYSFTQN